jgi:hypothetical protein
LSFFFEVRNFVEFRDLQGLGERSRVDLRLWLDSIDSKELRLVSLRIKDGDDEDRERLGLSEFGSLWIDGQSKLSSVGWSWVFWKSGTLMKDGKLQAWGFDTIAEIIVFFGL